MHKIKIHARVGWVELEAREVANGLALHRPVLNTQPEVIYIGSGWVITHLKSGARVGRFDNLAIAKRVFKALPSVTDWTQSGSALKRNRGLFDSMRTLRHNPTLWLVEHKRAASHSDIDIMQVNRAAIEREANTLRGIGGQ